MDHTPTRPFCLPPTSIACTEVSSSVAARTPTSHRARVHVPRHVDASHTQKPVQVLCRGDRTEFHAAPPTGCPIPRKSETVSRARVADASKRKSSRRRSGAIARPPVFPLRPTTPPFPPLPSSPAEKELAARSRVATTGSDERLSTDAGQCERRANEVSPTAFHAPPPQSLSYFVSFLAAGCRRAMRYHRGCYSIAECGGSRLLRINLRAPTLLMWETSGRWRRPSRFLKPTLDPHEDLLPEHASRSRSDRPAPRHTAIFLLFRGT